MEHARAGVMLSRSFGIASRALSCAVFAALALVALPHCANGDGSTSSELPDDGETSKLESNATSKEAPPPPATAEGTPTSATPADAGAAAVSDAASPADAAGCSASSECAPVSCTCKVGKLKVDGRLCTAGVCAAAQKDVCPTACGLLGGWSGT